MIETLNWLYDHFFVTLLFLWGTCECIAIPIKAWSPRPKENSLADIIRAAREK